MMDKLRYGDLPDPPTYDSIIKSSIKYRTQKLIQAFYKKSIEFVTNPRKIISRRLNKHSIRIYSLTKNILNDSKKNMIRFGNSLNKKIQNFSKRSGKTFSSSSSKFKESTSKLSSKIKSIDWEKITFISSFSLIVLFLIFSFIPFLTADNDNSTYICDGGDSCEHTSDCDITAYGTSACTITCDYWNIGGSGDSQGYPVGGATLCCGDDSLENYEYRQCYTGTTSGTFCSDSASDDACCDITTDCVYNGVCYTASNFGVNLDGSGEADAVCQSQTTYGRWVDCDQSSTFCSYCDSGTELPDCSGTACYIATGESSSHGEYNPGETECCGDDIDENYLSRQVDESVMEGLSDSTSDVACCELSNDCVASSVCTDSGNSVSSVDSDSDNDYCLDGEWVDCNSDSDCSSGHICYTSEHECINVNGYIIIKNLGITGIENTNQEYTSSKNVMLSLNYTENATKCRYTNYINEEILPDQDYSGWTDWESCLTSRIWQLSETAGLKTVYYQIEYTNLGNVTLNDTIYYNYTGSGLDETYPTKPYVYHANFTKDNQNITIFWENATDPESEVLGIPLFYEVYLYNESDVLLGSGSTTSKYYTFDLSSDLWQRHGIKLYANVTVINSANLKNSTISDYLVIDLIGPNIDSISGEAYNITAQDYMSINYEDSWFYANKVNLSWEAYDTNSSIYAYSYFLDKAYRDPDNVPEGRIDQLYETVDNEYSNLDSGKYYFTLKARDVAGNWGPVSSFNFSIDNSPPSIFRIISEEQEKENITFEWSESTDAESDIAYYNATLIDSNGAENQTSILDKNTREVTFYNLSSQNYSAVIYAYNGAGLWRSTGNNQMVLDITPPVIKATPNRTVITNYPLLKAWTDEQAVCYYNYSNSLAEFEYTNTSYHETKLNYTEEGHHEFVITCKDLYENRETENINFTIRSDWRPDDIITSGTLNAYENTIKTFSFQIVNPDGQEITGLLTQNFNLKIGNKNHEFTVFDIGNGYYNLSFNTPEYGSYDMDIEVKYMNTQIDEPLTLTINKLGLNILYEDPEVSISDSQSHLSYYTGDTRIGIATDENLESNYEITDQNNKLNISGIGITNNIMIFNTKPGSSMLDRNKKINNQEFLESVSPSFGYRITDEYKIIYKLLYENYVIRGSNDLRTGKHDISILYNVENGQNIIRFQKSTQDGKVVLVSD